jgi:pimeloyl-ACP methyl ester carboxylesterase
VVPGLERAGHAVVAVDLPNWPGATLPDQAEAIVAAAQGAERVVLVAQSMGGFSAPLACDRLPVDWLVLPNAMIPKPGETAGTWWGNTGQGEAARTNDLREGRDPDAGFDPERRSCTTSQPTSSRRCWRPRPGSRRTPCSRPRSP